MRNLAADGLLETLLVTTVYLMLLPVPWIGCTIIEETCDEFGGYLTYLTQSEELLIRKSCEKIVERSREQVGPAQDPGYEGQAPKGRNTERFRKKRFLIFERLLSHTWSLRNCVDFLLILLLSILLTCCRFGVSLKNQQKAPLINYACSVILERFKRRNWFPLVHHGQLGR